ncbi:hypothetical protein B0T18DRAFT_405697 [Schizothecium vesticola]|uniref:Uncharacterized protein n=1 Tax=Schizothecium vesticola TaxID=314040 RepID=A0AA40K7Q0_9PEZI|nr:hypothetical protein B0T18DRAFT_405697 [Schizothecium vesticola]
MSSPEAHVRIGGRGAIPIAETERSTSMVSSPSIEAQCPTSMKCGSQYLPISSEVWGSDLR